MKKLLFSLAIASMMPISAFAAALPFFATYGNMPVMCCAGTKAIYRSSGIQVVNRFKVTNPSPAPIDLTSVTIRFSGNYTNSDLGLVSFWDDVNGVLLGDASLNFTTKSATLTGTLATIPSGGVIEVTTYVRVKAGATLGNTGTFEVDNGDVVTSLGAATGSFPGFGPMTIIYDPPVIATPATITVLSPNGGETLTRGLKYTVSWSTVNAPLGSYVRNIELWQGGVFIRYIDVQSVPPSFIGSKLCPSQSVRWVVPNDLPPANNYRIRVRLFKGTTDSPNQVDTDQSNANFRIN